MPGYIDDMSDGLTDDGMKQYGVRAFTATYGGVWAVGTKSGGSGWKLFTKSAITDASWDLTPLSVVMEGNYTLYPKTFLTGDASNQFFVTTNSSKTWLTRENGGSATENWTELSASALGATSARTVADLAPDGNVYASKAIQNILSIDLDAPAVTDDVKTTGIRVLDVQPGEDQLGIFGYRYSPHFAQLLLWDYSSLLIDQNIEFGKGRGTALGYLSGTWVGVVDENLTSQGLGFDDEENGIYSLAVKYATGGSAETLTRVYGKTNTNAKLWPNRSTYRDAMLFEARIPTDSGGTTFKGGVWAIRRNTQGGIALSHLLDTESLGSVESASCFGSHFLLAHGGDGSISRLDDFTSGTYDVTAVYESLMFGTDTPNLKELKGISVQTEDLPSGASVVVKYRTDEDDSWTTLSTSSTTGTEIHNFTTASGSPIGRFQEIQFRVELTGNAPIKNIYVSLEELDTTPYDS